MANLSNINNKFLVTTGGNILIGQTATVGSSIFQVTGNATFAGNVGIVLTDTNNVKLGITGNSGLPATSGTTQTGLLRLKASNNATLDMGCDHTTANGWLQVTDVVNLSLEYNLLLQPNGGNVGIGTTMNINKLDVAGNINVQGGNGSYLTFNNGDANIVINNNGSGRDLSFKTYDGSSNSERMRIDKDGNLGIGTTSPTARLDVLTNSATGDNSIDRHVRFRADNGEQRFNFFVGRSGNSPNLQMYDSSEVVKIVFNTADNSYFNGGNLGIGTTSPTKTLQVNGSIGLTTAATDGNKRIHTYPDDYHSWYYKSSVVNNQSADVMTYYQQFLIRHQDSTNVFIIRGNGNVGIGETTPDQKLNVREDGGSDVFRGIEVHNNDQSQARAGICFKAYDWVQSAIWHGRTSTAAYAGALVLGTNPNTTDLTVSGVTGRMWILNNGDVGIGTDSPTAKLDINGTVRYRGSIYNQLSYQVVGNYSANTWYTFATSATLTQSGIYIIVAYIEDFTAGGANYYTYAASTNFYWSTIGTNRVTAFNFPPMLGTGHATGVIPSIRITQELGTSGALSKLQWQSSYTYTNLQNAGGKILKFDLKRIGA
jgi:hypothetical protein